MRSSLCTDHLSEIVVMGLSYQDENIHTAGEKPFEGDQKVHHRSGSLQKRTQYLSCHFSVRSIHRVFIESHDSRSAAKRSTNLQSGAQASTSICTIPQCSMRISNSNSGQGHKENGKGQIPLGEYATITWRYQCLLSFVDVKMLWSCLTPYLILRFRYS